MDKLDDMVRDVKSNRFHARLLQILSSQLEPLVSKGSPDLGKFYADLQQEELLAKHELEELQQTFPMQQVNGLLN